MKVILNYDLIPLKIIFTGKLNKEIIKNKILPFKNSLQNIYNNNDVDKMCKSLLNLKIWAKENKVKMKINTSQFFETMFSLYCKKDNKSIII